MAKIDRKLGKSIKGNYSGTRRVSPIKPGLRGARNWASAQIRSASYNRKKFKRMVLGGILLFGFIIWLGLWLGGFTPHIKAGYQQFIKQRLMGMGFVVKTIDVVGEGRIREANVKSMLGVRPGDYLYDMDIKNAQARIENLGWVDTAIVRRLWPNRIVIHINERRPYALWQSEGRIRVVDMNGDVINGARPNNFANLPFIVGVDANQNAIEIQQALAKHPVFQDKVETIVFVGQRRWDVLLVNGSRILLPEQNVQKALSDLAKIEQTKNILEHAGLRIDMRIAGRIGIVPVNLTNSKA